MTQVRKALKGGGFFGSIVPTANQVSALLEVLLRGGWAQIEAEEILLRAYKIVPQRLRPDDRMVGHTGYLVFARKIEDDAPVVYRSRRGTVRRHEPAGKSIRTRATGWRQIILVSLLRKSGFIGFSGFGAYFSEDFRRGV